MLDLKALTLFVAVAERLSVSRAAAAMHISQSALSRQIQGLERDLEIRLFDRIGKKMVLTAEGEDLLPRVGPLLEQARRLSHRVKALQRGEAGFLCLGATPQTIEAILSHVLRSLREKNSAIETRLIEGPNDELLEYVETGAVHAAIAWAPNEQKFERLDLFKAKLYAVLPPGHPAEGACSLDLSELGDWPILSLKRGFMTRSVFDQGCVDAGLRISQLIESDSTQTLWALAKSGMGVAIVSSTAVTQLHKDKAVPLTLEGRSLEQVVSAVWNARRYQPALLQAFLIELKAFLSVAPEGEKFRQFTESLV
ncbi:MAG: LysR family transcriptional regulator [Burkholderiaceae bacterium]|nr:LysR family transcriptional regulator [Burkholderiaceae bacterium]